MINSYHDKHPKSKIPTTFHKNVEKFNCYYLLLLALEGPIFFRSVFTYMLFWGKIGSTFVKCTHSVDKKWAKHEKIVQCNNKHGYVFLVWLQDYTSHISKIKSYRILQSKKSSENVAFCLIEACEFPNITPFFGF